MRCALACERIGELRIFGGSCNFALCDVVILGWEGRKAVVWYDGVYYSTSTVSAGVAADGERGGVG